MSSTLHNRRASPAHGAERLTVGLTNRAASELRALRIATELTKTELVNRALCLYYFIEQQRQEGKQLAVYDQDCGEFQPVHIA